MGSDQSQLLRVGVTMVRETRPGAHQSSEMGTVAKEVCRGGVDKSRAEYLKCPPPAKSMRFALSEPQDRRPEGSPEPKPGGRKAKARPFLQRGGSR